MRKSIRGRYSRLVLHNRAFHCKVCPIGFACGGTQPNRQRARPGFNFRRQNEIAFSSVRPAARSAPAVSKPGLCAILGRCARQRAGHLQRLHFECGCLTDQHRYEGRARGNDGCVRGIPLRQPRTRAIHPLRDGAGFFFLAGEFCIDHRGDTEHTDPAHRRKRRNECHGKLQGAASRHLRQPQ